MQLKVEINHLKINQLRKTYEYFISHKTKQPKGEAQNEKFQQKRAKVKKNFFFLSIPVFAFYLGNGAKQAIGGKLHQLCEIGLQKSTLRFGLSAN